MAPISKIALYPEISSLSLLRVENADLVPTRTKVSFSKRKSGAPTENSIIHARKFSCTQSTIQNIFSGIYLSPINGLNHYLLSI